MKKVYCFVLVIMMMFAGMIFANAEESVVVIKSLRFVQNQVKINIGDEALKLEVTIQPENATNQDLVWTSDDETVVQVDDQGAVTGVKAGKTVVRVTTNDPNLTRQFTAQCTVTVSQPVTSITTDLTEITLAKGAQQKITATILPEDASNRQLKWTSADNQVARANANGSVSGVNVGETEVTCEASDGSGVIATIKVRVYQPVMSMQVKPTTLNAYVGKQSEAIAVTIKPDNAENQKVIWSSSDESIATVDENGVVTGASAGTAKITATSTDPVAGQAKPKAATCTVKVTQAVEKIELTVDESKTSGKKLALVAMVYPENATNQKLKWTCSDQKIATVSNGMVKAKKGGYVYVMAEATDGSGVVCTCKIYCESWSTGIYINGRRLAGGSGITPKLEEGSVTDKTIDELLAEEEETKADE